MIPVPSGFIPVADVSTGDVLSGDRTTEYRWEVLEHNTTTGVDSLAGYLDGVNESTAGLKWSLYASVKGSGSLSVMDRAVARSGSLRVGDVPLEAARIRPVLAIQGLPDIHLGVFLPAAAPEDWTGLGRTYKLELLDRATVLDQDAIEEPYSVGTSTPILEAVADVIESAGEAITVDATETRTLAAPSVWLPGTSKLEIVNDLLAALNYGALWVDGIGNYRATPYVLPAARGINYELLNGLPRELVDGDRSIYGDAWSRDRDFFRVPNKVIAIQSGSGETEALVGSATNTDPTSPFSYPRRGNRWKTITLPPVETPAGTDPEIIAFLNDKARASLVALSSPQATVKIKHLPIPVRVSDVARFANAPAEIDARHVFTSIELEARPLGLMSSTLQELIDL